MSQLGWGDDEVNRGSLHGTTRGHKDPLFSETAMTDELTLFVETAYKLETSSFWKWATARRGASNIERISAGDWLAHDGLSSEALDSFCLSLRLLIQNQDGFSIAQIKSLASTWPDSSSVYRDGIQKATENLHIRLNERSLVQLPGRPKTTNHDVFDVIFYGGIAHANPGKRDEFRYLVNSGPFSFFVFQSFLSTLFHYRNCIQVVAYNIVRHLEMRTK